MFFFKQKTAYELRISDWSSDVCSSDLVHVGVVEAGNDAASTQFKHFGRGPGPASDFDVVADRRDLAVEDGDRLGLGLPGIAGPDLAVDEDRVGVCLGAGHGRGEGDPKPRQPGRPPEESVPAPTQPKTRTTRQT